MVLVYEIFLLYQSLVMRLVVLMVVLVVLMVVLMVAVCSRSSLPCSVMIFD